MRPRRDCAPSPACGGGLGWGCCRDSRCSCGESFPHPHRIIRCDIAEALLRRSLLLRTAAKAAYAPPQAGEVQQVRGQADSTKNHPAIDDPAIHLLFLENTSCEDRWIRGVQPAYDIVIRIALRQDAGESMAAATLPSVTPARAGSVNAD